MPERPESFFEQIFGDLKMPRGDVQFRLPRMAPTVGGAAWHLATAFSRAVAGFWKELSEGLDRWNVHTIQQMDAWRRLQEEWARHQQEEQARQPRKQEGQAAEQPPSH